MLQADVETFQMNRSSRRTWCGNTFSESSFSPVTPHCVQDTFPQLLNTTTSDPHQWRTTQVDPPPTHGIAIPAAEVGSRALRVRADKSDQTASDTHRKEARHTASGSGAREGQRPQRSQSWVHAYSQDQAGSTNTPLASYFARCRQRVA